MTPRMLARLTCLRIGSFAGPGSEVPDEGAAVGKDGHDVGAAGQVPGSGVAPRSSS